MEDAISEVLPSTTQMGVLGQAKEFLRSHYTKTSMFRAEFHIILNDMLTTDEFERAWEILLQKYGLENNPFLVGNMRSMLEKMVKCSCACVSNSSTRGCSAAMPKVTVLYLCFSSAPLLFSIKEIY
jgi:hypothetical protein